MQIQRTTSNQILKSINQQKVMRLIFTEGPISRVKLAEKTGLTQQTITNIVRRLLSEELVLEQSPVANAGGRKPIPLVINGQNMYGIGIEIAIKYIRGSLMNFQDEQIADIVVEVPKYKTPEHPMDYIYDVIDKLLDRIPQSGSLKGIGCSIQGLVDTEKGTVIYSPGLRWNDFPLKSKLREKYQLPIYIENDANLLSLVENLNGSLRNSKNNIALKFDYGLGGALVQDKRLVQGSSFVAGEFGHLKVFTGEDALKCHCGATGCLTTLASVSGLFRNGGFTLDQFNEGVRNNDYEAMMLFNKVKKAMVMAVSNLITFFNPDHILITGELIDELHDVFVPQLKEGIMKNIPETCQHVKLLHLTKKPDESALAMGLVMDEFFGVPFDQLSLQFSR